MGFMHVLNKIESSKVFKNFKEKNPDAELCAGFFVLDFISKDTKQTLDYKLEQGKKVFTFSLEGEDITVREDELVDAPEKHKLKKIKPSVNVEVEELKSIAGTKKLDEGLASQMHKIIAVLQIYEHEGEEKQVWNLTCMLEGLQILHILIDSDSGDIIKFEKKSMMDFIKKQ